MSIELAKTNAKAIVPIVVRNGPRVQLGTGFLIQTASTVYVVASEHNQVNGEYHCVVPDATNSAANSKLVDQWMQLEPLHFVLERHQLVLRVSSDKNINYLLETRKPYALEQIVCASTAKLGEEVEFMGFWSKNPGIPCTLRRGHVSGEGMGDFLASLKVVKGNSGAPIWSRENGAILGTVQKNLYDSLTLSTPICGVTELESFSDLTVITSLQNTVEWIRRN